MFYESFMCFYECMRHVTNMGVSRQWYLVFRFPLCTFMWPVFIIYSLMCHLFCPEQSFWTIIVKFKWLKTVYSPLQLKHFPPQFDIKIPTPPSNWKEIHHVKVSMTVQSTSESVYWLFVAKTTGHYILTPLCHYLHISTT